MKIKRAILFVIFLSLLASYAYADIELKAEVDKKALSTDNDLVYKLAVSSSDVKTLPLPKFPDFKGFLVLSRANTSNISITGREAALKVIYVFIIRPQEIGKLTIAPAEIKLGDKVYQSGSFEIEVKKGKRKILKPQIPQKKLLPEEESPKEEYIL